MITPTKHPNILRRIFDVVRGKPDPAFRDAYFRLDEATSRIETVDRKHHRR